MSHKSCYDKLAVHAKGALNFLSSGRYLPTSLTLLGRPQTVSHLQTTDIAHRSILVRSSYSVSHTHQTNLGL